MTPDIIAALEALPRFDVTTGGTEQAVDGEYVRWADIRATLAALSTSPAGQEVDAGKLWLRLLDEASLGPCSMDDCPNCQKAIDLLADTLRCAALSSVEPAGNGREDVLYTDDEVKRRAQRIVEIANKYEGYDELALASVPVTVLRAVAMVVNGAAFAPLVARMAATPPAPALDGVVISREFYEFLLGEGHIDGAWFGDSHDTMRGKFWWRTLLRSFNAALSSPSEEESATVSREGEDHTR